LNEKDKQHFRLRLLEERSKVMDELNWVEANYMRNSPKDSSGEVSGHSTHLADMGTDSDERDKAYLIGDSRGQVLEEIDDALLKIDKGTYGKCEICGEPIPRERLEAVPYAKYCLKHQAEEEKRRGASR
jgi:DnaK suppressor protein